MSALSVIEGTNGVFLAFGATFLIVLAALIADDYWAFHQASTNAYFYSSHWYQESPEHQDLPL